MCVHAVCDVYDLRVQLCTCVHAASDMHDLSVMQGKWYDDAHCMIELPLYACGQRMQPSNVYLYYI